MKSNFTISDITALVKGLNTHEWKRPVRNGQGPLKDYKLGVWCFEFIGNSPSFGNLAVVDMNKKTRYYVLAQ